MPDFVEGQLSRAATLLNRFAPTPTSDAGTPGRGWPRLIAEALDEPIAAPPFSPRRDERVCVVISDGTRDEPRRDLLHAVVERAGLAAVSVVVASGTHRADALVVPKEFAHLNVVVHDSDDVAGLVDLGITSRGTRVRLNRHVAEADHVVVTGRIRPHYFAGFSGGVKGVFPGCAARDDILQNHLQKADESARLGAVDENLCRLDMEEAALTLGSRLTMLNVLADVEGRPVRAAYGHPVRAHRQLVAHAADLFGVRAPRSRVLVVADQPPVCRSLYQASKMLPPCAPILEPDGVIVLVADCRDGLGPTERVNRGIYELGIKHSLPPGHRIILVSEQSAQAVQSTYAEPGRELVEVLERVGVQGPVPLIWRAAETLTLAEV